MLKIQAGFNLLCLSGKCLIGNGLEVIRYHNDPKHTANASEIIFGEQLKTADKTLTVSRLEYYRGSM